MDWLKQITAAFNEFLNSLSGRMPGIVLVSVGLATVAVLLAYAYNVAYMQISETLPATAEQVEMARNRLEIARLRAAELNAFNFETEKVELQRQIEHDKVRANQKQLGLEPASPAYQSASIGVAPLAALGEVISKNLPAIIAIGVLMLIYNTFSSNSEHWRLVLHIALLLVLAGGAALWQGISAETNAKLGYKDFVTSVTSGSVGLFLMLFGTILSAYALHVLHKRDSHKASRTTNDTRKKIESIE